MNGVVSTPKVSVIIPAYNSSSTIGAALDSVAAQTFGDYETIVVDDSSTDTTVQTVEQWAAGRDVRCQVSGVRCQGKREGQGQGLRTTDHGPRTTDDRPQMADQGLQTVGTGPSLADRLPSAMRQPFRLICMEKNGGPAAARNCGIAEARGEWLAFLDADDAWLPRRLEVQCLAAKGAPDVALWCGRAVPLEGSEAPGETQQRPVSGGRGATGSGAGVLRRIPLEEFALHNPVATSTVLVRKEAVTGAGGFDTRFRGPEDYDLWMRVAARWPVALLDDALALYRFRPGSLSMDDRLFLREVLGVLEKAFSPGGALAGHGFMRCKAEATQFWNASWMAFNRGSRPWALRYLFAAVAKDMSVGGNRKVPLLWRYLFGRPIETGGASPASGKG